MFRTRQVIVITIIGALFIGLISLWAAGFITQATRTNLTQITQAILNTTHEAVLRWADETQQTALAWANSPQVLIQLQNLFTGENNAASLHATLAQRNLETILAPALMGGQNQAYFVIDLHNRIVSSNLSGDIDTQSVLGVMPTYLRKLLAGHTILTLPIHHDFPDAENALTILAGAPVISPNGQVIGALVFYIDPNVDLADVLQKGRFGDSGETYMLDSSGRFLSNSRFTDQLESTGLLSAGQTPVLNLRVSDPGVNLLEHPDQATPVEDRPLTFMAQRLVSKEGGFNIDGYRDYRGVDVVGAWIWDSEYGFGLATEIDKSQALGNLGNVYKTIAVLSVLSAAALIAVVFISRLGEERELSAQRQYEQTVEGAMEAIICFDSHNTVTAWNRQAELIFGWRKEEALGHSMLGKIMPAETSEYYVNRLREISSDKEFFMSRQRGEVVMIRRGGRKFPADVFLVPIRVGKEEGFSAVVRDLTDIKQAQARAERSHKLLERSYDATLRGWSRALDLRDNDTEGHTQRVTEFAMKLARGLGVPEKELVNIYRGSLLHDIGKIGIPDRILHKRGPLNEEEWEIMRQHPVYAYKLLRNIPYLKRALEIPYCHHEKWDGTGYPRGLEGEAIPYSARLFSVVDVWDALSSDRPYRSAWSRSKVIKYIKDQSGIHFDPRIVDAFLGLEGV